MGKHFRTDHLDQGLLFPPSLHDWLPEGHLARFVVDVIEELDLGGRSTVPIKAMGGGWRPISLR